MMKEESKSINILSFDGGGSRGVMEVFLLQDIMNLTTIIARYPRQLRFIYDSEEHPFLTSSLMRYELRKLLDRVADPIHPTEVFDMIVGTSTGSVISFGLVGGNQDCLGRRTPMSLTEVIDMYKSAAPIIFEKKLYMKQFYNYFAKTFLNIPIVPYSQDGLQNILEKKFGETTLRDFDTGCIAGAIARQHNSSPTVPDRLVLFDTRCKMKYDVTLILKASSDAPIYFETPVKINDKNYIDGGVGGNCPLAQAIPRMKALRGESSYINSILSIAPTRVKKGDIPTSHQWKYWLQHFPDQLSDSFPIYFDVKENNRDSIVQRICLKSPEACKFELDEINIKNMLEAIRKESLDDILYFTKVFEVAIVVAARCNISKAYVKPLRSLEEIICRNCVETYHFDDELYIRKAILENKRSIYGDEAEHPEIATSYYKIGLSYINSGHSRKAIDFFEKSLQVRKILLYAMETNCLDVSFCYDKIGICYEELEEYKKSIFYHDKSLEIRLKFFGTESSHLDMASSYSNIGICFQGIGDYQKALRYHEKSLNIRTDIYGRDTHHQDIASSFCNIGTCYAYSANYDKAIKYHKSSLKMKTYTGERSLGRGDIILCYNSIAICHQETSNYKEAVIYHERSLETIRDLQLEHVNDPEIALAFRKIGLLFETKRYKRKAEEFYSHSLNMYKTIFDGHPNSPKIIRLENILAKL